MFFIVPANNSDEPPKNAKSSNVELDLDDAPFLEETVPAPTPKAEPEPVKEEKLLPAVGMPKDEKPKNALLTLWREQKKKLIIAASLLLIAFIGINYFIFSTPSDTTPEPPPVAEVEPRRITLPATPQLDDAPALPQFITKWQPFTIPLKGNDGEIVLFTMTLSIPTDDPLLHSEIMARQIILRDAIYYYLSRRPLEELMNKNNAESLRVNIVGVMNEHLTSGKISSIYVEDYYAEHL